MPDYSPLFSIVVVSLNPGQALHRTLASIESQTFRDFEIVVKDGGSSDGTIDYLKNKGDSIQLCVQADKGIFDAMNQAIDLANGEYIQFLNCGDTFYDCDSLAKIADAIQTDKMNCDLYFGDIHKPGSRSGFSNYPKHLSRYYIFNYAVCHQAWLVKRPVYQQNRFSTGSQIGGDDIWFKQMVGGQQIRYRKINAIIVTYQGGGTSENPQLQQASKPYRNKAKRAVFSKTEYHLYGMLFRLRTLVKKVCYDSGGWRLIRKFNQWRHKKPSV